MTEPDGAPCYRLEVVTLDDVRDEPNIAVVAAYLEGLTEPLGHLAIDTLPRFSDGLLFPQGRVLSLTENVGQSNVPVLLLNFGKATEFLYKAHYDFGREAVIAARKLGGDDRTLVVCQPGLRNGVDEFHAFCALTAGVEKALDGSAPLPLNNRILIGVAESERIESYYAMVNGSWSQSIEFRVKTETRLVRDHRFVAPGGKPAEGQSLRQHGDGDDPETPSVYVAIDLPGPAQTPSQQDWPPTSADADMAHPFWLKDAWYRAIQPAVWSVNHLCECFDYRGYSIDVRDTVVKRVKRSSAVIGCLQSSHKVLFEIGVASALAKPILFMEPATDGDFCMYISSATKVRSAPVPELRNRLGEELSWIIDKSSSKACGSP